MRQAREATGLGCRGGHGGIWLRLCDVSGHALAGLVLRLILCIPPTTPHCPAAASSGLNFSATQKVRLPTVSHQDHHSVFTGFRFTVLGPRLMLLQTKGPSRRVKRRLWKHILHFHAHSTAGPSDRHSQVPGGAGILWGGEL